MDWNSSSVLGGLLDFIIFFNWCAIILKIEAAFGAAFSLQAQWSVLDPGVMIDLLKFLAWTVGQNPLFS